MSLFDDIESCNPIVTLNVKSFDGNNLSSLQVDQVGNREPSVEINGDVDIIKKRWEQLKKIIDKEFETL